MSYIRKGILGVAITLTFGAAQFAFGEDLTVGKGTAGLPADSAINRAGKADRAPVFSESVAPTRTLSIHVDSVPDTSVLVRLPRTQEAQQGSAAPVVQQTKGERRMTACEPVVSVLTDIAKHLQPGSCVT
jgi:hypothetical protein